MKIDYKKYMKHKPPPMEGSGYIALLFLFLCFVANVYMQFTYEGTTEHIYSLNKTANIIMVLLFPISALLVAAYIFFIHVRNNKNKSFLAVISLLTIIFASKYYYTLISDIFSDLQHIKNGNYVVSTGKPSIKIIRHGYELTLDKYTFIAKTLKAYPTYGAPQLRRIKASKEIEIKHYGNRVLEINEKR